MHYSKHWELASLKILAMNTCMFCVYSHETEMVLSWRSCKAKPQKCWRTCYMFKHFFSPFNISNSLSCCASQTIKHVFGHGSLRTNSKGRPGGIWRLQTGKAEHAKPSCFPAHQRLQRLAQQTESYTTRGAWNKIKVSKTEAMEVELTSGHSCLLIH